LQFSSGDPVKDAERESKAKAHNEEVFRRIGWWRLAHILFEKGWPERQNMPLVYYSNFENAARFISRENAAL